MGQVRAEDLRSELQVEPTHPCDVATELACQSNDLEVDLDDLTIDVVEEVAQHVVLATQEAQETRDAHLVYRLSRRLVGVRHPRADAGSVENVGDETRDDIGEAGEVELVITTTTPDLPRLQRGDRSQVARGAPCDPLFRVPECLVEIGQPVEEVANVARILAHVVEAGFDGSKLGDLDDLVVLG